MSQCVYPHPDRPEHQAEIGLLCQPGYARLEQHLAELPALTTWLQANIGGASTSALDLTGTRAGGDSPLPIRADVLDHILLIRATLVSWAILIAEERQLRGPAGSMPSVTATFLLAHLPWAAEQAWVDDLAQEAADLHRDAHHLCPSRPRIYHLPIPCPEQDCGFTLTRKDGDDYVQCQTCGRLWTEAEYGRLMWTKAELERNRCGWLTPEDAGLKVGVDPRTVRNWARRGLLSIVCAVLPGDHDHRLRVDPAEVTALAESRKSA